MGSAAVLLVNPKTPFNVGTAIRACSIFGVETLRWTGDRIMEAETRRQAGSSARKDRLPREERLKDYTGVDWREVEAPYEVRPMEPFVGVGYTPVCVEIVDGAQYLDAFEHPAKALYVFGPEDGDLSKGIRHACHRFVQIRTGNRTPLNLGMAVNLVLYDRFLKLMRAADAEALYRMGL